jgi:hypothetical protein
MLKNVSLALPGGYDLIASLRPNNVFFYWDNSSCYVSRRT